MLYVVDSVTRQWLEQARKAGQPLGAAAVDGSFAAGVKHVTELLPSIMTDIINTAPEPQKVRFLDMLMDYKLSRNYDGGYESIDSHCTRARIRRPICAFRILYRKLTYYFHLRQKSRNSLIFGSVVLLFPPQC